ncbi:MAG TPA: FMN-binding negative transcriptional regulator [Ensifer sp.]|jgi:transcriptional regulator|uniref:FMN-binding negative transcriptional regulator n=1 Tax=Ensifer sp. TaxID=1872086 RepID=UPI002E0DE212|nr:FMN-binding negative transcriptional regulator [Ensifer sp.]
MYTPPAFKEETLSVLHAIIEAASLATLVTATADGLMATPLPLLLDRDEGPHGTLYGHVARANPQGSTAPIGQAMATFSGPDAYISPSWYASKREHGKVVPTWNYVAVHAYGEAEFFSDEDRLLDIVTRLTNRHEAGRSEPWRVDDAPPVFIKAQLRGIIGLRLPIDRLDGKRKMSQNRSAEDRAGVAAGLKESPRIADRPVAEEVPV